MVSVGEQSGNLEKVLVRLADSYDKSTEIRNKVTSAVTYPIILAVLMLCVIVLLLAEVLPMFDDVLSSLGGEMPGITRVLMDIGSFISAYFYILLAIIALIVIVVIAMRQTKRGAEMLDALKLKTPIQKGIIKTLTCARFSRSLAMLLRSGIGLAESVRMTSATVVNTRIKSIVLKAADRIEKGDLLEIVSDRVPTGSLGYARTVHVIGQPAQPRRTLSAGRYAARRAAAASHPWDTAADRSVLDSIIPRGDLTFTGIASRVDADRIVIRTRKDGDKTLMFVLDTQFLENGLSVPVSALKPGTRVFVRGTRNFENELQAYQVVWGEILEPRP
jgi:hypothetical protein